MYLEIFIVSRLVKPLQVALVGCGHFWEAAGVALGITGISIKTQRTQSEHTIQVRVITRTTANTSGFPPEVTSSHPLIHSPTMSCPNTPTGCQVLTNCI